LSLTIPFNFNRSVIVAAHPDDEILWFSSILDRVDRIVFCYHCNRRNSILTRGRDRLLSDYPFNTMISLNIEESNVYKEKHYQFPIETRHGLISFHPLKYKAYQKNFAALEEKLKTILPEYQTVFTHNPWGEYGHEEHVQVYRVLKKLQVKFGFDLLFNNYISKKSLNLGKRYLFRFQFPWFTCHINKPLYDQLRLLYIKSGCWTWPDNWHCFNAESFLKDGVKRKPLGKYDHLPPLNIIRH
jgi:hypothetical protein